MLKHSPSRNQRSKEFKVKHALQICVVLAICIWLLYQVKQTYEKKFALEQRYTTTKLSDDYGILKLGRKGLDPRLEEFVSDFKRREVEGDGRGHEDKEEEKEGNNIVVTEDEIDGQDQDKTEEEEPEQLEDLIDEDDSDGKGVEMDSYSEDVDLVDNQHRSGVGKVVKEETLRRR